MTIHEGDCINRWEWYSCLDDLQSLGNFCNEYSEGREGGQYVASVVLEEVHKDDRDALWKNATTMWGKTKSWWVQWGGFTLRESGMCVPYGKLVKLDLRLGVRQRFIQNTDGYHIKGKGKKKGRESQKCTDSGLWSAMVCHTYHCCSWSGLIPAHVRGRC